MANRSFLLLRNAISENEWNVWIASLIRRQKRYGNLQQREGKADDGICGVQCCSLALYSNRFWEQEISTFCSVTTFCRLLFWCSRACTILLGRLEIRQKWHKRNSILQPIILKLYTETDNSETFPWGRPSNRRRKSGRFGTPPWIIWRNSEETVTKLVADHQNHPVYWKLSPCSGGSP